MTVTEVIGLLGGGPVVGLLIFIIVFGFRALVNGTLVLGKYHSEILLDRNKEIERLTNDNKELLGRERESRELAWRATDIAKHIAKEKSPE